MYGFFSYMYVYQCYAKVLNIKAVGFEKIKLIFSQINYCGISFNFVCANFRGL